MRASGRHDSVVTIARRTAALTRLPLSGHRPKVGREQRADDHTIRVLSQASANWSRIAAERPAWSAVTSPRCRLGKRGQANRAAACPAAARRRPRPAIRPARRDAARSRPGWRSRRPRARPARSRAKPWTVAARLRAAPWALATSSTGRVEPAGDLGRAAFDRAGRGAVEQAHHAFDQARCRRRPSPGRTARRTYSREVIQPSRL